QAQMETLAAELNAAPAVQADEAYILGGSEAPAMEEPAIKPRAVAGPSAAEPLTPRAPQTARKPGWSLFGRRKALQPDMREEPRIERRATAEAMRPLPPEPLPPAEDLFPDHARDEQFEIPAFLRRQSN
ncbi:MAG: hypothetical protein ACREFW_07485, partial [Rhizomicrobium sp.]